MKYIGENLLPGQIGHFLVLATLLSALVAFVAFLKNHFAKNEVEAHTWRKLGRYSFYANFVFVVSTFGVLYYLISNHYFEYKYVWQHSSRSLPQEYLLSCFWEGQEGSYMLWSFWLGVLGLVLIKTAKQWEGGTVAVVSFAQFFIATMLLGIYIGSLKIGSSPFVLLRNEGVLDNAPIFKDATTGLLRADYLTLIQDGSGLNTLLQNYWMVIHPPVLFLGFASSIVPFAFAFAGIIKKDHSWVKPALPWGSFSAAILGIGIMMGAAWAYESLSFGGYWAWDPVENASLVPWIMLVAGLHTNLIYNSTGYSLRATYLFYFLSFVLVLYSSFLTKSGILGDTSVHAFTGADMTGQLVAFVLAFLIPSMFYLVRYYKQIPTIHKEEEFSSREFWMFIGALSFFLSAAIIIAQTSTPVFNKIFGTKFAKPEDVEFSYNQFQIFVAIILGLLTGITQYLKYKKTSGIAYKPVFWAPILVSLAIGGAISTWGNINYDKHGLGFLIAIHVAIWASVYAVVGNTNYLFAVLKGKTKAAGASIAHIGFGLVLVGILISSAKKEILSWNTVGLSILQKDGKENPAENITLFKGVRTDMGTYNVTYLRDTLNEKYGKKFFELLFENKATKETYKLYPDVLKNNKGMEGFAANPDAKHYWNKDIFVYVTSWLESKADDTAKFVPMTMKVGDTAFYSNGLLILENVAVNPPDFKRAVEKDETAMVLTIKTISKEGKINTASPAVAVTPTSMRSLPDSVVGQGLVFQFNKVANQETKQLEIGIKENKQMTDLLTLKVLQFPFINVLWIGIIVMSAGFFMAMFSRLKRNKAAL